MTSQCDFNNNLKKKSAHEETEFWFFGYFILQEFVNRTDARNAHVSQWLN